MSLKLEKWQMGLITDADAGPNYIRFNIIYRSNFVYH